MLVLSILRLIPLLLVTAGFAAPSNRDTADIPSTALLLPADQLQLVGPGEAPKYVSLGVGNQNYTCFPSGKYM